MPAAKADRALAEVEIGQSPSLLLLNQTNALTRGNAVGNSTRRACLTHAAFDPPYSLEWPRRS